MRNRVLFAALSLGLLVLDQWTKQWAMRALAHGGELKVIDGLLSFRYAENPGIAFSFFNTGDDVTRWLLVGVSSTAAVLVGYFLARTPATALRPQLTLSLLLAGIVGNLIDRASTGRVVDFIDVFVGQHHWPTFNVADSAISVGAVLLGLDLLRSGGEQGEKADARQEGTGGSTVVDGEPGDGQGPA